VELGRQHPQAALLVAPRMFPQFLLLPLLLQPSCNKWVEAVAGVRLHQQRAQQGQLIRQRAVLLREPAYGFLLLARQVQREAQRPMVPLRHGQLVTLVYLPVVVVVAAMEPQPVEASRLQPHGRLYLAALEQRAAREIPDLIMA
jgi:hypothetical protein